MTAFAWLLFVIAVGAIIVGFHGGNLWKDVQDLLGGYGSATNTVTK